MATHPSQWAVVLEPEAFDPYGRPEKAGWSQPANAKKGSPLGFRGAITERITEAVVLGLAST